MTHKNNLYPHLSLYTSIPPPLGLHRHVKREEKGKCMLHQNRRQIKITALSTYFSQNLGLFEEDAGEDGTMDEGRSQASGGFFANDEQLQLCCILLFLIILSLLSSFLPLIIKSFKRVTSDSFTGFTINSSAPSSKHL